MGLLYNDLFRLLQDKGLNKSALRKMTGISSSTLAKLSKNENVGMDVLEKICAALHCQPGDILSFQQGTKNKLLQRLREEEGMNLGDGIYHETQIKLAYHSNYIEGHSLSEDQTRHLFETNMLRIEEAGQAIHVDDIMGAINHFEVFRHLLEVAEDDLSEPMIKEFHKLLKAGTFNSRKEWSVVGDYKKKPNSVGDFESSGPEDVPGDMAKLLDHYAGIQEKTVEDFIDFYYRFECIHPFQDENGVIGRLILFKECLKYEITPIIIEDRYKMFYYRWLKEFEHEKGYLIDTCLNGQMMYQGMIDFYGINR